MSYVYFIGEKNGPIKIGVAIDVKSRLSGIQTHNPNKLNVLGIIKGDVALERKLHKKFKKYNINREWFERSEELINFINSNTIKPKNLDIYKPQKKRTTKCKLQNIVLSDQLKSYMKKYDLTLTKIYRKTGVSKSTISSWLNGSVPRDIRKLKAVADIFNTTIDNLCWGSSTELTKMDIKHEIINSIKNQEYKFTIEPFKNENS